ncbi:hypothetical protein [Streptomyces prunicolor]|uniref:hypothetical protein n=1 Tax=Streptomyces prunicolor TaxID=67348 RepID=UPI0033C1EAD0
MTTEIVMADTAAPVVPEPLTPTAARRLATLERVVYGAAGAAATVGPQLGNGWLHGGAVVVGVGVLARLWSRAGSDDHGRLLTTAYRSLPALGLSGAYVVDLIHHGAPWWEYAVPAGAAVLSVIGIPWTRSRGVRRAVADLPAIVEQVTRETLPAEVPADPYTAGLRELWNASTMTGETRLAHVRQYSPARPDFEAVIVAPPGEAVPYALTQERTLAAVFDVEEAAITTAAVPGRGPGMLAVRVAPSLVVHQAAAPASREPATLEEMWALYVSATSGAAPGVQLVQYDVEDDRVRLWLAAPRGRALRVDHAALCSALDVDDSSRLVVEGAGPREAIAYVYRTNPLLDVRAPTAEDLTMGPDGRVALGVAHDGSPARIMLFNPQTGRAQNGLTAGTTGAGKSGLLRLMCCAQRLSGVVSWVADVQGGMSMPEMEGRVDWFARGEAETMAQLEALHAVKVYRETHSNGRGDFDLDGPWSLIQWSGDEINRLLSSSNAERRKRASWMISDLQRTGHKVGIGVDLGVQSLHLKELGDNPEIREKGKEGHVFLMRTASSSTQSMGLDGIAPPDAHITNIPERIYATTGAAAKFDGTASDEGEPTPGMAWLIAEARAILMRTFTLHKVDGRFPLIEELMDAAPMPMITEGEAAAAGVRYANRNTRVTQDDVNAAVAIGEALAAQGVDPSSTAYIAAPVLDTATGIPGLTDELERIAEALDDMNTRGGTLKERIVAALTGEPAGLPLKEIRSAVGCGTDGGPATGSVNNAVTALASEGLLIACGGGVYRLP